MESTSFSSIKKKEKDIENIYSTELSEETNHSPKKKEGKINKAYDDSEKGDYSLEISSDSDEKSSDGSEKDSDYEDLKTSQQANFIETLVRPIELLKEFLSKNAKLIKQIIYILLSLGVTVYMVLAMISNFDRSVALLVIWSLVVGYTAYALVRDSYGKEISKFCKPFFDFVDKNMYWIKWVFVLIVLAGLATWIALDTSKRPDQLISGGGYLVFLLGLFITSNNPKKVVWRTIFWGMLVQVCFGMFILRTEAGFEAFNWLGNFAQTFINFVDAGVEFVYGESWPDHSFAFKTLSVVIYFSSFISIMYHLGAMQWLILKIAWIMQITLKTSATESMVAAGNIFVGQTESPLLIRPYIEDLTTSELFAVMTCGFGTISGSVLGAYLGFGIEPSYVITACVMAAPCALYVAKLQYPETKKSKFADYKDLVLDESEHRNFIEAAFVGVSSAIPLVLNIGANLIAFLGLLAAVNGFLSWFGGLLDFPELSFELMCSYIFLPVTYLMGIEWVDCFKAAELIGIKIFLNEFIAYEDLSEQLDMRDNGTVPKIDPVTGDVNWVDERTEAIITYALCGFANIGSLGIMLGGLGAMAPKRQGEMAEIVTRALVCGIFVSILNACVAGFLYVPRPIDCSKVIQVPSYEDWKIPQERLYQCCQPYLTSSSSNISINCCSYPWDDQFKVSC